MGVVFLCVCVDLDLHKSYLLKRIINFPVRDKMQKIRTAQFQTRLKFFFKLIIGFTHYKIYIFTFVCFPRVLFKVPLLA